MYGAIIRQAEARFHMGLEGCCISGIVLSNITTRYGLTPANEAMAERM